MYINKDQHKVNMLNNRLINKAHSYRLAPWDIMTLRFHTTFKLQWENVLGHSLAKYKLLESTGRIFASCNVV